MTETTNEIWTNAENLAKLVANAYVSKAYAPKFQMNKVFYTNLLLDLISAKDKSRFIRKITDISELIEDKKEITNIVKYIHNLPIEEVREANYIDSPENSFGYFRVLFNFLLKCEEVEKRKEENVG